MSTAPMTPEGQPTSEELQSFFDHLESVRDLCQDYNKTIGERSTEMSVIWSVTLFLRSIVAINAVILLIKNKFYDDTASIIRTLLEIELQLAAIKTDPEIAKQLVATTEKYREKRLKAISERGNQLPGGVTQEAVAEQLAQIRASGIPSEIQKRQLAEKSQDKELLYVYDTVYRLLSDVAHASATGRANYLEKDPSTGKLRLNPNSSLLSPGYLIALAAATQLNILDLTMHILGDPSARVNELRKRNGAILARIRDTGTIQPPERQVRQEL